MVVCDRCKQPKPITLLHICVISEEKREEYPMVFNELCDDCLKEYFDNHKEFILQEVPNATE